MKGKEEQKKRHENAKRTQSREGKTAHGKGFPHEHSAPSLGLLTQNVADQSSR